MLFVRIVWILLAGERTILWYALPLKFCVEFGIYLYVAIFSNGLL